MRAEDLEKITLEDFAQRYLEMRDGLAHRKMRGEALSEKRDSCSRLAELDPGEATSASHRTAHGCRGSDHRDLSATLMKVPSSPRRPVVTNITRQTIEMVCRGRVRTVRRWYITLRFGDVEKKLTVSPKVIRWLNRKTR